MTPGNGPSRNPRSAVDNGSEWVRGHIVLRRYPDGEWWLRIGRFTLGTDADFVTFGERQGWTRVWRFARWSATWDVRDRNVTS